MARTVLVIDDDVSFLRVAQTELPHYGFKVVSLVDTVTVMDVLDQQEVHLIITDMRMPTTDGYDVVSMVREMYPDLPIVLTTAHAVNERVKDALRFELVELLRKPFDAAEFHQSLLVLFPGLQRSLKSAA